MSGLELAARCGDPCSVLDWARWGLMALTGPAGGPPLAPDAPVAGRVRALLAELAGATGALGGPVLADPARELAGRARAAGWVRSGRRSANGSCHLLGTRDGWWAINLARPDDVAAVPAILAAPDGGEPLAALAAAGARHGAAELAGRAQLLGVPAAALGTHRGPAVRTEQVGRPGAAGRLVLDFSALWAGPLAAHTRWTPGCGTR